VTNVTIACTLHSICHASKNFNLKLSTTFSLGLLKTTFNNDSAFLISCNVKGTFSTSSFNFSISSLNLILNSSNNSIASFLVFSGFSQRYFSKSPSLFFIKNAIFNFSLNSLFNLL
jgi:hypothetical protein